MLHFTRANLSTRNSNLTCEAMLAECGIYLLTFAVGFGDLSLCYRGNCNTVGDLPIMLPLTSQIENAITLTLKASNTACSYWQQSRILTSTQRERLQNWRGRRAQAAGSASDGSTSSGIAQGDKNLKRVLRLSSAAPCAIALAPRRARCYLAARNSLSCAMARMLSA